MNLFPSKDTYLTWKILNCAALFSGILDSYFSWPFNINKGSFYPLWNGEELSCLTTFYVAFISHLQNFSCHLNKNISLQNIYTEFKKKSNLLIFPYISFLGKITSHLPFSPLTRVKFKVLPILRYSLLGSLIFVFLHRWHC